MDRRPLPRVSALQAVWSTQEGRKPTVKHRKMAAGVHTLSYACGVQHIDSGSILWCTQDRLADRGTDA